CHWHAAQWRITLRLFGLLGSCLHAEQQRSADFCINRVNERPQSLDDFARGNVAPTPHRPQVGDGQRRQIFLRHSTTFGTTKRPFACRGALLSACSAAKQSPGVSPRKTLKIGSVCAAASTWLTSA